MKDRLRVAAASSVAVAPAAEGRAATAGRRFSAVLADYVELTKPRLNLLVVVTSAGGYYLASPGRPALLPMAAASVGTALVAGGAAALNQVFERDTDGLMERTRRRPLPAGRVAPEEARAFGWAMAAAGLVLLGAASNALAALLALATIVVYLSIYTPLKRRSPLSTLVGAVPGALPALIGWTARSGAASAGGWTLFAIVFFWQIPHFMAIAWMFRDDYRRAGFPMLSVIDPDGRRAGRQAVLYAAALVPASVGPALVGVAGPVYGWSAVALSAALLVLAGRFAAARSDASARLLFFGSITYLPLIWAMMMIDH
ncbi:MAG: protoheme IX farnesyltransferase [Acidobacteria bacterium RIFCSPLOWO2_02_FULL_65_29]|nr:MAG: protoheme IX farnesyltransferase [Acidobacteria bacterium RIFCSPLOWO2_02_FULL_65_29]